MDMVARKPQPRYLNARAVSMTARGANDPRGGHERRVGFAREVSPMTRQHERNMTPMRYHFERNLSPTRSSNERSSSMRSSSSCRSKLKVLDDPNNDSEPESDPEANAAPNKGDLAELANLRRTFVGQTFERRIVGPPRPPPVNRGEHFKRLGRIAGTNRRVLKQHVRNIPMADLEDAVGLYPDAVVPAHPPPLRRAGSANEQPSASTGLANPGSSSTAPPLAQIRTPRRMKLPALERTPPRLELERQDSNQGTASSPTNKAISGAELERADVATKNEELDVEPPQALPPMDVQPSPAVVVNPENIILEIAPPVPETPRRPFRRRLTPILRRNGLN